MEPTWPSHPSTDLGARSGCRQTALLAPRGAAQASTSSRVARSAYRGTRVSAHTPTPVVSLSNHQSSPIKAEDAPRLGSAPPTGGLLTPLPRWEGLLLLDLRGLGDLGGLLCPPPATHVSATHPLRRKMSCVSCPLTPKRPYRILSTGGNPSSSGALSGAPQYRESL